MHGNALRTRAKTIDARSLRVECPQHLGILLPVTNVKISYSNNTAKLGARKVTLYLEALCVYCDGYHYLEVQEGSIAGLPILLSQV